MADDGGVAAKLAGAKKTLEDVSNSNVSAKQSNFAPKHEFSHASYSMAKSAGKSGSDSGIASEAHSAGEGIKARMENESAARASLQ